jgi:DNA ligase (NAD+)
VFDFIRYWDTERKNLPVATDGIVLKINSLRQQKNLGYTAKSPRWAIAYKFQAERACTRLNSISYQVGRTGAITPVANLDPVQLSGTIVKRASLHNADIIKGLDLHIGDMVYVEKGGEIIPKIVGKDAGYYDNNMGVKIDFINRCPVCGTPLVRAQEEASHYCPNDLHCAPQIIGRLEHFVSRKAMNISLVGPELIQQYYRNGFLHDVSDFYHITHDKKVAESVARSVEVPFERVLFALGIRFVGEIAAKTLARKFKNIDSLMSATAEQLLETDGIGNVIAESLINYFSSEENRALIERLRQAGLQFTLSEEELSAHSTTLQGQSIVISGVFARHSRDEYKRIIEQHGGKNVGSISGKTSFILAGENMGPSKLEKAEKLGVRIVSEDEFLALIEQE